MTALMGSKEVKNKKRENGKIVDYFFKCKKCMYIIFVILIVQVKYAPVLL